MYVFDFVLLMTSCFQIMEHSQTTLCLVEFARWRPKSALRRAQRRRLLVAIALLLLGVCCRQVSRQRTDNVAAEGQIVVRNVRCQNEEASRTH